MCVIDVFDVEDLDDLPENVCSSLPKKKLTRPQMVLALLEKKQPLTISEMMVAAYRLYNVSIGLTSLYGVLNRLVREGTIITGQYKGTYLKP